MTSKVLLTELKAKLELLEILKVKLVVIDEVKDAIDRFDNEFDALDFYNMYVSESQILTSKEFKKLKEWLEDDSRKDSTK